MQLSTCIREDWSAGPSIAIYILSIFAFKHVSIIISKFENLLYAIIRATNSEIKCLLALLTSRLYLKPSNLVS